MPCQARRRPAQVLNRFSLEIKTVVAQELPFCSFLVLETSRGLSYLSLLGVGKGTDRDQVSALRGLQEGALRSLASTATPPPELAAFLQLQPPPPCTLALGGASFTVAIVTTMERTEGESRAGLTHQDSQSSFGDLAPPSARPPPCILRPVAPRACTDTSSSTHRPPAVGASKSSAE